MEKEANIIEIFSSIQGEGPYIGYRQIFIRFAECNLNCKYCDTPFQPQEYCNLEISSGSNKFKKHKNPIASKQLLEIISNLNKIHHHSISLTGGEPLLNTEFLMDFLPAITDMKVYLETNGTLFEELEKIITNIDIISMDLKLKSSTGIDFPFEKHKKFIEIASKYNKEIFAKAVITSKITDEEINNLSDFINNLEHRIPLILQPVSSENKEFLLSAGKILEVQENFLKKLDDVRVIPQTHKFLDLL